MAREQTAIIRQPARNGGIAISLDGALVFDAVFDEQADDDAELTDWPAELGLPFSDNYRPGPAKLRLTVYWTDTPLRNLEPERDRSVRQYQALLAIRDNFLTVDLIRTYRLYQNMAILRIGKRQSARDGTGNVTCTLELREVRTVRFRETTIPAERFAVEVEDDASDESDRSRQTSTEPSPEVVEKLNRTIDLDEKEDAGSILNQLIPGG